MRNRRKWFAALSTLLFMCVYTSSHSEETGAKKSFVTFSPVVMDEDHNRRGWPFYAEFVSATFLIAPGTFHGSVKSRNGINVRFTPGRPFKLDVAKLELKMAKLAKPSSGDIMKDIVLDPPDTRFARAGVMLLDELRGEYLTSAEMLDENLKDYAVLAYFDRPCTMRGTMKFSKNHTDVDLAIPRAGVYWIRMAEIEDGNRRLSLQDPPSKLIFRVLADADARGALLGGF